MSNPPAWLLASLPLLAACGGAQPIVAPQPAPVAEVAIAPPENTVVAKVVAADEGDLGPIPVTSADPQLGPRGAPVTIVEFADFQCPFCMRVVETLEKLRAAEGPGTLRFVWKNNPLPFHDQAKPAAQMAMAVFQSAGNDAFFTFHDAVFHRDTSRPLLEVLGEALQKSGMSREDVLSAVKRGDVDRKIDDDIALAKKVGANGTPAFFINGVFLNGAQPFDKFQAVIEPQLVKAKALVMAGMPETSVYAYLTKEQWSEVKPADPPKPAAAPDDRTVFSVPVGSSPMRGKATALVTIVEFADFQCPFCGRVEATLAQLPPIYGDKIRLVWKNEPLPFHPRAEPAAELALEARTQKGDTGFWLVHDALFADQAHLDDAGLGAIAAAAHLNVQGAMNAVKNHKHAAVIAADQDLGEDVQASGTPHFFINGRRLVGAQSLDKFKSVIDEEMAKAEAMVRGGVAAAQVYERIRATAAPPAGLPKASVPPPTRDNPSRGPATAKIVVQEFSDFQCPFCKRAEPTLTELEKAFPGQIRIVWRNLPLPFHQNARPAAEAAMEAFQQKGAAGFWAMHDLLFAAQDSQQPLDRPTLDGFAAQLHLDMVRFANALDNSTHEAAIALDEKLAANASIVGTPGFVINGYFLSGAQPIEKFKKIVKRALAEK
jgi:protein-disulfide isomerase